MDSPLTALRRLGIAVLAAMLAVAPAIAAETPRPAHDFTDMLGANVHITWDYDATRTPARIAQAMAYLGARHLRDGPPVIGWTLPAFEKLAMQGLDFDVISLAPQVDIAKDVQAIGALRAGFPHAVAAYEGPNEFNLNSYVYQGAVSKGDWRWSRAVDRAAAAALRADPRTAGVPYMAASIAIAGPDQVAAVGSHATDVDIGNWHVYFHNGMQPRADVFAGHKLASAIAPGKPVWFSEMGCSTYDGADGWGRCGDAAAAQKLVLNMWADAWLVGARRLYVYELLDDKPAPAASDREAQFGLFTHDGTPKPQATALRNLGQILAASGNAPPLDYRIAGLSVTARASLLGMADGGYALLLWDEPSNGLGHIARSSGAEVTVSLPGPRTKLTLYDPLVGTAPIARAEGADKISFRLVDHPLVLRIGAPAGAVRSVAGAP